MAYNPRAVIQGVPPIWAMEVTDFWLKKALRRTGVTLSVEQDYAVRQAMTAAVLDGAGGVGPDGQLADMVELGLWAANEQVKDSKKDGEER